MKCKRYKCNNELLGKQRLFCSFRCKNIHCVDKRRWEIKLKSINYKGGKCEKCGYNKCPTALEFHHIDPINKEFSISHLPHTRSWARTNKEIDKCKLLCANCHREEEFIKQSKHKLFIKDLAKEYNFLIVVIILMIM